MLSANLVHFVLRATLSWVCRFLQTDIQCKIIELKANIFWLQVQVQDNLTHHLTPLSPMTQLISWKSLLETPYDGSPLIWVWGSAEKIEAIIQRVGPQAWAPRRAGCTHGLTWIASQWLALCKFPPEVWAALTCSFWAASTTVGALHEAESSGRRPPPNTAL